jgi:hypothetical protein
MPLKTLVQHPRGRDEAKVEAREDIPMCDTERLLKLNLPQGHILRISNCVDNRLEYLALRNLLAIHRK